MWESRYQLSSKDCIPVPSAEVIIFKACLDVWCTASGYSWSTIFQNVSFLWQFSILQCAIFLHRDSLYRHIRSWKGKRGWKTYRPFHQQHEQKSHPEYCYLLLSKQSDNCLIFQPHKDSASSGVRTLHVREYMSLIMVWIPSEWMIE